MRSLVFAMLWMACTPGSGREPADDEARHQATPPVAVAPPPAAVPRSPPVPPPVAGAVQETLTPTANGSTGPALVPRAAPSPGVTAAAHDAEIATIAATDDGRVAVSADWHGGMRLWPRLDGTREPVVVNAGTAAEQLAIARDDAELVIAAAGPLGQLAVIRTAADGQPISHTRVDLERSIVALHATPGGFVGLRDDQVVAGVDLHGGRLGTLQAGPGERITALASRRGRLLALVTTDGGVRARWIEISEQLAWGSESPPLRIDPDHAVLAPDHERVAALSTDHKALVIVSLKDGRTHERSLTEERVIFPIRPLGFVDDRTLAVRSANGEPGWWRGGEWKLDGLGRSAGPAIVSDHHLVTGGDGSGANLVIDTPDGSRYLGFRLLNVRSMVRRGQGWMISDRRAVLGINGQLAARSRYRLHSADAMRSDDVVLLDTRHAVTTVGGKAYLVDLAHPDEPTPLTASTRIQYEPTTHLLASDVEGQQWLGRYDPRTSQVRETLQLDGPGWIELLDPAMNQGNVARKFVVNGSTVTIVAIRAIDFAADPPLREAGSYTRKVPDELTARDDRLTARAPPGPREIAGGVAALFPAVTRHHTSPDGALVAIVGGGRITLRDRERSVRWAVALPGTVDVAWAGPRDLIAFGSGMARIDLATGAALDRRCGWEFGLWGGSEAESELGGRLCEAP